MGDIPIGFIIFILLCFFLPIGIAIRLFRKEKKKRIEKENRCNYRVQAVCINRYSQKIGKGENERTKYFTIWQFWDNGVAYQTQIECNMDNFSEIGEQSIIRVNPYNLNEAIKEKSEIDIQRKKENMHNVIKVAIIIVIIGVLLGVLEASGVCPWLFVILDILG